MCRALYFPPLSAQVAILSSPLFHCLARIIPTLLHPPPPPFFWWCPYVERRSLLKSRINHSWSNLPVFRDWIKSFRSGTAEEISPSFASLHTHWRHPWCTRPATSSSPRHVPLRILVADCGWHGQRGCMLENQIAINLQYEIRIKLIARQSRTLGWEITGDDTSILCALSEWCQQFKGHFR